MPSWLQGVLGHLSALEAVLAFLGSMVLALIPVFVRIRKELRKAQQAMASVPPSGPPAAGDRETPLPTDASRLRDIWALEERVRALSDELQVVGEDHARTCRALLASTQQMSRLRARVAELEGRAPDVHEVPTVRPRGNRR